MRRRSAGLRNKMARVNQKSSENGDYVIGLQQHYENITTDVVRFL